MLQLYNYTSIGMWKSSWLQRVSTEATEHMESLNLLTYKFPNTDILCCG